ncbi:BfmA/BtgA family mobilization protein [Tamlana sp. 2201CG12-4]|uniref:BfmA/BtgA family mobilization protein n=1 Tax=Tamlana sp. 2201CG12-4 TaxID=3112582 RepID=UPI002DB65DEF|nr:BfmA/BtgA family mobilization protein [Tamlana sp. 2201CG12-4]MEC3908894.1 BfmA/BtgA family mobilization protein [Tamlana sp. 2201CG12-4]
MEDSYQKYRFSAISIKREVAGRFRKFSKKVSSSHTGTLLAMLDFFEVHQISPLDSIDGSLSAIEIRIKRRINNAIAIIRDIEKSQTLPTVAMLQSLFEQQLEEEKDNEFLDEDFEFIEKKFEDVERGEAWEEETTIPKIRYDRLEEKMEGLKADFKYVLEHVKQVKQSFGKDYLKLELSPEEIEKFRRVLKNLR